MFQNALKKVLNTKIFDGTIFELIFFQNKLVMTFWAYFYDVIALLQNLGQIQ